MPLPYHFPAPRTSGSLWTHSTAAGSGRCCCSSCCQLFWAARSAQRSRPARSSWRRRWAGPQCTLSGENRGRTGGCQRSDFIYRGHLKETDAAGRLVPVNSTLLYFLCRSSLSRIISCLVHSPFSLCSSQEGNSVLLQGRSEDGGQVHPLKCDPLCQRLNELLNVLMKAVSVPDLDLKKNWIRSFKSFQSVSERKKYHYFTTWSSFFFLSILLRTGRFLLLNMTRRPLTLPAVKPESGRWNLWGVNTMKSCMFPPNLRKAGVSARANVLSFGELETTRGKKRIKMS